MKVFRQLNVIAIRLVEEVKNTMGEFTAPANSVVYFHSLEISLHCLEPNSLKMILERNGTKTQNINGTDLQTGCEC